MRFRKDQQPFVEEEVVPEDPTSWLIDSSFAEFVLLSTYYTKIMVMLGYTFMHGTKLFPTFPSSASLSYKFISMILQCTGGGILVPIFINAVPVPLSQDAYPVCICISFLLNEYLPILREIMKLSMVFKVAVTILYETMRAAVVVKLTSAAGKAIDPSDFAIPLFGPIFCGTVAGCGGAFLPLNKGLDPIKLGGMAQPMLSAFVAATFYHLFTNTSLSDGVIEAPKKAHVIVTFFFIAYNIYTSIFNTTAASTTVVKKSSTPKKKKA